MPDLDQVAIRQPRWYGDGGAIHARAVARAEVFSDELDPTAHDARVSRRHAGIGNRDRQNSSTGIEGSSRRARRASPHDNTVDVHERVPRDAGCRSVAFERDKKMRNDHLRRGRYRASSVRIGERLLGGELDLRSCRHDPRF